jgi:hypothetical protein
MNERLNIPAQEAPGYLAIDLEEERALREGMKYYREIRQQAEKEIMRVLRAGLEPAERDELLRVDAAFVAADVSRATHDLPAHHQSAVDKLERLARTLIALGDPIIVEQRSIKASAQQELNDVRQHLHDVRIARENLIANFLLDLDEANGNDEAIIEAARECVLLLEEQIGHLKAIDDEAGVREAEYLWSTTKNHLREGEDKYYHNLAIDFVAHLVPRHIAVEDMEFARKSAENILRAHGGKITDKAVEEHVLRQYHERNRRAGAELRLESFGPKAGAADFPDMQ